MKDLITDSGIVLGIMNNDPKVWRYIYGEMKNGFMAMLKKLPGCEFLDDDDLEDLFQDTCIALMTNVKQRKYATREGASLFAYMVEIGKRTAFNMLRKKNNYTDELVMELTALYYPESTDEISAEEKQLEENRLLDRAFDSISEQCKQIFKKFYWDKKDMDEIASMMGFRDANSAKVQKSKCLKKFKDTGKQLIENGELADDAICDAAERAALKDILEEERMLSENADYRQAALDIDFDKE